VTAMILVLKLHRLDKGSFGIGLLATSSRAVVHVAWCAAILAACCCTHGGASVYLETVADTATTSRAGRPFGAAGSANHLPAHDHECGPCRGRSHLFAARSKVRPAKTLVPSAIPHERLSSLRDQLGGSRIAGESALLGRTEATLRLIRATVLLI